MPTEAGTENRNVITEVSQRNRSGGERENALKREKGKKFKEAEVFQDQLKYHQ